jgi:type VI secretion system VasD/TssJ family lipoprotein
VLLFSAVILSGCVSDTQSTKTESQAIAQVKTPYLQGGIKLDILTDPDLNALNNIANSCIILVIQAQNTSSLNKLLSNPFMLKKQFSAGGAQDDILKVDRYVAMPGQASTLHIDRSENTRYIAVVAGYYPFPQKQHMILVAIPVITENTGWLFPDWHAHLAPLTLRLRLGGSSITQFQGATPVPVTFADSSTTSTASSENQGK